MSPAPGPLDAGSISAGTTQPRTIDAAYSSRANGLNAIRLGLAGMVLVSHSFILGAGRAEPGIRGYSLGAIAVAGFFCLSGFLVARSWASDPTPLGFTLRRALRILPAYWASLLLVAFVAAPIVTAAEGGSVAGLLRSSAPASFVLHDLLLVQRQFSVAGLPRSTPFPGTLNGSTWTLAYEALAYLLVAVLGRAGMLRPRRVAVLLALCGGYGVAASFAPSLTPGAGRLYGVATGLPLVTLFLAGVLVAQLADRVVVSATWGMPALCAYPLALAAFGTHLWPVLFPFAALLLCGGCLWLGAGPLRPLPLANDLSYGGYLLAFPVQQTLAALGLADAGLTAFTGVSIATTGLLALASWRLIEAPSLRSRRTLQERLGARSARLPRNAGQV